MSQRSDHRPHAVLFYRTHRREIFVPPSAARNMPLTVNP
ncbi:unnamed protein product [Chondrus crispus]|uniref:Uncharacterized protein n=1 Tax=Chondrus crispus TaxID=2769 RepID=R7QP46_CHOCR|nr:unnamed protein product [Chondrus crispus]CDF39533.1 unnamed protein product [Chondrus crispus]|eukprot:XP_005713445.1 unnamed protein product [Chondrus crispus]